MTRMVRALAFVALLVVIPHAAASQVLSVLHIKVVLLDADRKPTPVPRHALLISDNPASDAPRLIVTAADGTADVRLRPGNYTVESDQPVAFLGSAYQWTQTLDIVAGRDAVLELTAGNAEIGPVSASTSNPGAPPEADPSAVLMQWQDSVVAVWSPTTHASGFIVDPKGLIATNQRSVGTATSVEVQLTPKIKLAANVLVADSARDVAILWVDPAALTSLRPVPLECAPSASPRLVLGQTVFTIGTPLREPKAMASGAVSRLEPEITSSDLVLAQGSTGGPVFASAGGAVGLTSVVEEKGSGRRVRSRVISLDDVCTVFASATKKMAAATPPKGTPLPVEPLTPFPVDALKDAAQRRAGSLNPYQASSADFDIAFITPVMTYGAQSRSEEANKRERTTSASLAKADQQPVRSLMEFNNWSGYVADSPPVLLIRVTPKMVEGFWKMVARGAAQTQGVSIPAMKSLKSGFLRMRALCGDAEATPIHAFTLEQRVSENNSIAEGLYVFDPGSLGPSCGTVKLVLYSEKEPEKGDIRVIDPKVIEQIWQDFTPYRAVQ